MVPDRGFGGPAAVVGGSGGGEVPFHEGGAGDKGYVIEVDYLGRVLIWVLFCGLID